MPFDPDQHADRLLIAALRRQRLESRALGALRKATSFLSLSFGDQLRQARAERDPLIRSQAKVAELTSLLAAASESFEILADRWDKVPERQRPHYTPPQRFRILRIRDVLAYSAEEAARRFRISPGTITRWDAEARSEPEKETVGSLVKPAPPVRRYADVVHHLAQTMNFLGLGGNGLIASTLARAGWRVSREWVRLCRKKPPVSAPEPPLAPRSRAVRANRPNHVWMMDLTEVKGLFALRRFAIATVFDVFSRIPLLSQVFEKAPTARETTALFRKAVRFYGPPPHFVSDQGRQFTAQGFKQTLVRFAVAQRFGAIGRSGSIALIERFWRSLKEALSLRFAGPLTREDLEQRVFYALAFYGHHRPHQGLGGATPAEAFLGLEPAHLKAVHPPRGRPGESVGVAPFRVEFLDADERFPIIRAA